MSLLCKATYRLKGHTDSIMEVRFSPNGDTLASAGVDGNLCLWSPKSGELLHGPIQSELGKAPGFCSLAWLDNNQLLAGMECGELLLLSLNNSTYTTKNYSFHTKPIECISHEKGSGVACAVQDVVLVFNFESRRIESKRKFLFPSHSDKEITVTSLHWAPAFSSNALVVTYLYQGVVIWDFVTADIICSFKVDTPVGDSALSPDHQLLAISNLRYGFDIYQLSSRKRIKSIKRDHRLKKGRFSLPVLFTHAGQYIFEGSSVGRPTLSHLRDESPPTTLDLDNDIILSLDQCHNRKNCFLLACGTAAKGSDCYIQVFESELRATSRGTLSMVLILVAALVVFGATGSHMKVYSAFLEKYMVKF